ncbi:MAG: hypothetical protein PF444_02480 [Bacteroidales bacterium]|jgi:hypothetical protein|nr:hypothetical protein [Bacteroidales bacterium]
MKKQLITLISFLLLVSFVSQAAKWRVCNTPGIDADFTSFKLAHDGASAGDTLMFEGSNLLYGDRDTLDKQLVIVGPGYFLDENDMSNDYILPAKLNTLHIKPEGKGSVIMGMSIVGAFDNLTVDGDDIIITRNYIQGTIALCMSYPIKNIVISKNYLAGIDTRWGSENLFATGVIICNNIVTSEISFNENTTATIINNVVGSGITVSHSTVKSNISSYLSARVGSNYEYNLVSHDAPAGIGNTGGAVWDELFVSGDTSSDGAYVLSENSTAKGAGEGNADCGAFGGNDSYILSGYPPFPVVFNAQVPPTGTTGLLIKIEARSQK